MKISNKVKLLSAMFAVVVMLFACNKNKVIDIVLPNYNNELVVECYLEPGKPYRLLLTESVSYFDAAAIPDVSDATVTINYKGVTDTLIYVPYVFGDPDAAKVYNFIGTKIVANEYNEAYTLHIKDSKRRTITGTTQLLPPIPIDTVRFVYDNEDTLGYTIASILDDPKVNNFYRYILLSVKTDTTLVQSLFFDEELSASNPFLIKSGNDILIKSKNDFSKNINNKDKHILKLYHIEEAYYRFLKSVKDSRSANGNPFAQPPSIKSNVSGGIGIFTGFTVVAQDLVSPFP